MSQHHASNCPRLVIKQMLPLNELFLLNVLGYVVLVLVFWLAPR
jgi:hypothetical protein